MLPTGARDNKDMNKDRMAMCWDGTVVLDV